MDNLGAQPERKQVFLVEDDLDIRESILEVLRSDGFVAESAATCREALKKLRELQPKPSLILLDLRLPGEDGFQFRKQQKLDPSLAEIPIVLLSAGANLREKSKQMGAIDHLKKPVDIDERLDTVRRNCHV